MPWAGKALGLYKACCRASASSRAAAGYVGYTGVATEPCRGFSASPRGQLKVVHTYAVLRAGSRLPLEPLPGLASDEYWRELLPNPALLRRLARVGSPAEGPRRQFLPRALDPGEPWAELTVRGADESRALGVRLCRWLQDRQDDMIWRGAQTTSGNAAGSGEADDFEDEDGDEYVEGIRQGTQYPAGSVVVLASSGRRTILSVKALLDGLCLPGARIPINTAAAGMWQELELHWASYTEEDTEVAECRLAALELRSVMPWMGVGRAF